MNAKKVCTVLGFTLCFMITSSFRYEPFQTVTVTSTNKSYVGSTNAVSLTTIQKDAVCDANRIATLQGKTLTAEENELYIYIEETASSYGLDAELIHAIIMEESDYDTTALSSAKCQGLMQISPKWHRDRMERLGASDLYDAKSNVLVGCDFMAELLEDYDLEFALMIYNQGLDSAKATYQKKGQSGYSKKVMQNYKYLLDEE